MENMDELEKYIRKMERDLEIVSTDIQKKFSYIKFSNDKCPDNLAEEKKFLAESLCDVIYDIWISSLSYEKKQECLNILESEYSIAQDYLYNFLGID